MQPAIILDIDNTLLDTAVRKHALFKEFTSEVSTPSLNKVRADFKLKNILPDSIRDDFFVKFNTPEYLRKYPIKPYNDSIRVLTEYIKKGIEIIFVSGRPEHLREATINDLKLAGLSQTQYILYLLPQDTNEVFDHIKDMEFKINTYEKVANNYDVKLCIGDQPPDAIAAIKNNIPSVLLNTTINTDEKIGLINEYENGQVFFCDDWIAIESICRIFVNNRTDLSIFRDNLSKQYADWLSDLDAKTGIIATISAALLAACGLVLTSDFGTIEKAFSAFAMLLTFFSIMFSILAFTSRRSSGKTSGTPIAPPPFKSMISILLGKTPENMTANDPISMHANLTNQSVDDQKFAHVELIKNRYGTLNYDAISNLRLYELRSIHYMKLYAERYASIILIFGIFNFCSGLILGWLVNTMFIVCIIEKIMN